MTTRKETPDVLGAVLGEPSTEVTQAPEPTPTPSPAPAKSPGKRATKKSSVRRLQTKPRQWEYQVITFHDYGGWKPRLLDGAEIPDWKRLPDMPEFLNILGEEGWELAGTSKLGRSEIVAFFKRPRA